MEHFHNCLTHFERDLATLEVQCAAITPQNAEAVRDACWRNAETQLNRALGCDVSTIYRSHPVASVINRSAFVRSAFEKKYGYAGDKDLMEMIYDNGLVGDNDFARLLNAVFLNLPAAEAVRQRMMTMRREMNALAPGSRVLNLACGSARELAGVDNAITVDLADHDTHALAHAARHSNGVAADLLQLNAFEFIKGRRRFDTIDGGTIDLAERRYDLIYSSGLFDYVPVFADNPGRGAPALVGGLFDLLKPGGRLVVGNFATASENNPHLPSHRLMMELYAEWFLIYRTRAEMIDLARNLSPQAMSMRILNERFAEPDIEPTTIWFLEIARNA